MWAAFLVVIVASFSVLGWIGTRIYQEMPPLPERVVTTDGTEVIAAGEIAAGQNVWQALGGMEVGSVWGHGSYVAPDWLHREALFILDSWSRDEFQSDYATLEQQSPEHAAQLRGRLAQSLRTNRCDSNGTLS